MKRFVILILLFILFSAAVFAEDDVITSMEEEFGIDELQNIVPGSVKDSVCAPSFDIADNGLSFEALISKFFSLFTDGIKEEGVFLGSMCAFLILCAVMNCLCENFAKDQPAFTYVSTLILTTLIYNFTLSAFEKTSTFIDELKLFITTLMPTLGTLSAASGNAASAAVQNAGVLAAINVLDIICADVVLPAIRIIFALVAVGAVSGIDISGIVNIIKNIANTVCIACFTILCAILYFQTVLSSAADSLGMRTVKLAANNLIPIIGSMVGEASRTVFASISLIKSSVGTFAISVVIFLALIPIVSLFVKKTVLSLSSGVGKLLGCKPQVAFIGEITAVFNLLIALTVSAVIYFILALAIFIKTTAS